MKKIKKTRSDVGSTHKKRPYPVNKVSSIITGLSSEEYHRRHDSNPEDPLCRLAEHVGSLFRIDKIEKGIDGMRPDNKIAALRATADRLLEMKKEIAELKSKLEKVHEISM